MLKQYCHRCRDGGKQCIDVDTKSQVYLEMFHVKCSKCGAFLIS